MILDENENCVVHESGADHQNPVWSQVQRNDSEKHLVEMEGSGFLRNSSEELFMKSLMEGSMGIAAPNMESLGFKNFSHTLRGDSEELFNSWLLNGENHGYNSSNVLHRKASRRMSTELAALSSQQHGGTFQNTSSIENLLQQNLFVFDDQSIDSNEWAIRDGLERGLQASNLFLAKEWFQSSHPMTRSRSSELRRRYDAMQSIQTLPGMEATQTTSGRGTHRMKHDFVLAGEIPNQLPTFTSPPNSSTTPFRTPTVDTVSSVVSMLKGTLERKKLSNSQNDKENVGSFVFYGAQEVLGGLSSDQGLGNQNPEPSGTSHQVLSPIPGKDSENLQVGEGSLHMDINGFVAPSNPIQMGTMSQELSQSESSAAAPVLSSGFDICDGTANSGQTVCESSGRHTGNGNSEHSSKTKEFRERIFENNLKDDPKRGNLVRMRSVTSGGSVDKGDPTKKRRVDRSRKMAEAKERNQTPTVPSDMQSILKRCEALEKEVRSLKLNLSFMNRKDSEQTKQIEELQKQNEELVDEKERMLEEIERIISEPGKI